MARAAAPAWTREDLIVCEDGPRSGAWYFLSVGSSSWKELRRLAVVNGETPTTGRTLGYVTTDREVEHPRHGATGAVLRWDPAAAGGRR